MEGYKIMKTKNYKYIISTFLMCILLITPAILLAGNNDFQFQIGEELTYRVKWSFIRLGTLKLIVCDTLTINDNPIYHIKLFIDSNPLLFFVNMHNVYESYIDKNFKLRLFYSVEIIDDITYKTEYRIDYGDSLIHIDMTDMKNPANVIKRDDPFDKQIFDGTSMVYYGRANSSNVRNDTLSCFFESERGKVDINFHGKAGEIKRDELPSPVDTYYLDVLAHMQGIAGGSGKFTGWFRV